MKKEVVKAHENEDILDSNGQKIGSKKVFIAEGELQMAESLEDVILMTEDGTVTESQVVTHFNSSRRIEFQRILKAKTTSGKPSPKATVAKLEALAKENVELAAILRANGFTVA